MDTPVDPMLGNDSSDRTPSANPNPVVPTQEKPPEPIPPKLFSPGWFTLNSGPVFVLVLACVVKFRYNLNVIDLGLMMLGLGFMVFIHELGHFLAAKWCDVHVEEFSIGFGRPLPRCHFRYGETRYKIGWLPLGGYVSMIGEGDNSDTEEAEDDPRSFKKKTIGQRMLIISAGVVMNMMLGFVCFLVAYSHGIEERSPVIGWVDAGSPAWQIGIHSDSKIEQIGSWKNPTFDDIKPIVMGTRRGEKISFVVANPGEEPRTIEVEPIRYADSPHPTIGVSPIEKLELIKSNQIKDLKPYRVDSPAAKASPAFLAGDRLVGSSVNATEIQPMDSFSEFYHRLYQMRGKEMKVIVNRTVDEKEQQVKEIILPPAFTRTAGMRMQMGRIVAIRKNSPAATAKIIDGSASNENGFQTSQKEQPGSGDKIIAVEVKDGNNKKRWAVPRTETELPLDPLKLPFELEEWFSTPRAEQSVRITVLRLDGHSEKRMTLEVGWQASALYNRELTASPDSPLSIPCLGLGYHVEAVVEAVEDQSPAMLSGIQKGDLIKAIRIRNKSDEGKVREGKFEEFKSHQWAYVFYGFERLSDLEINLRIQRGTGDPIEVPLTLIEDKTWPQIDRGLSFKVDMVLQRAEDLGDAVLLGFRRDWRTIQAIYQNLFAMARGDVSLMSLSGPITIASVAYRIAGENIWQFVLLIAMLNVNLAIVNFLPIPVLDGGHMVFLIYEKIRGKPAPKALLEGGLWLGLVLILLLTVFVTYLDFGRIAF